MKKVINNKLGVSAVVATVLIIMITVAAVGIIWAAIIPMVRDGLGSSSCNDADISIVSSGGYTCYDSANQKVAVQVKKGSNEVNVTGVGLLFSSAGNSYSANVSYAFANNEYHTFNLDVSTFGDLEGISIAPLIKGSKKCGVVSSVNTIPNCNLADVLVLRPNGQPCDSSDKCISGYCGYSDNSLGNRVCTAGITDESNCDSGEQCQDRYCDTLNSICSDGIDGSGCSASYDCQSGSCDGSYCYTRQNTYVALGGSCDDSYVFCTEGSCIEGICRVTCSANADCNDNGGYCNTYNSYWNSFSNFCTNGALGVQCAASNQCESWLVCGSITYSCAFSCADNSECASGSHCHSEDSRIAYCTPNGWWPSNSVDCSDNNDCSSGFKCVDTNCVPGIPTCSSNEDCQSNGGYCSGISHLCTQGITGIDSCNNLDQCAAWQCGSNNKCGSLLGGSCGTNENDCQEGTCNGESCV